MPNFFYQHKGVFVVFPTKVSRKTTKTQVYKHKTHTNSCFHIHSKTIVLKYPPLRSSSESIKTKLGCLSQPQSCCFLNNNKKYYFLLLLRSKKPDLGAWYSMLHSGFPLRPRMFFPFNFQSMVVKTNWCLLGLTFLLNVYFFYPLLVCLFICLSCVCSPSFWTKKCLLWWRGCHPRVTPLPNVSQTWGPRIFFPVKPRVF